MKQDLIAALKKFASSPAPAESYPVHQSSAPVTNSRFLCDLCWEAKDILERGDSLIAQDKIPFAQADFDRLGEFCDFLVSIEDNQAPGEVKDLENRVRSGLESIQNISKYYSLKVACSNYKEEEVSTQIKEFNKRAKALQHNGFEGMLELYENDLPSARDYNGTITDQSLGKLEFHIHLMKNMHEQGFLQEAMGAPYTLQEKHQERYSLRNDAIRNGYALTAIKATIASLEKASGIRVSIAPEDPLSFQAGPQ